MSARRDHSTVHAGRRPRVPVASVTLVRMRPLATGRLSSHRVRDPVPLDARSTSRSAPASGRYRLSPLLTRHTACVMSRRPPNGAAQSARATTARRTASRANARAPHSSWRSVSRAPGGPPRHSHHQPCRVPVARASGDGSRRAPCCSSTPDANDACCPKGASTSSAARAPGCPARHAHSAPKPRTVPNARSRLADAASARDGPERAGSASERNAVWPPRARSATRVSPIALAAAPSARQRPSGSSASSSERSSPSKAALACAARPLASTPSEPAPAAARAPSSVWRANRPPSSATCSFS